MVEFNGPIRDVGYYLIEFESPTEAKLYQGEKFEWDECRTNRITSDCVKRVYSHGMKLVPGIAGGGIDTTQLRTGCTTTIGGGWTNPNYSDIIKCSYKQFVVVVQHTGSAADLEEARILADTTLKKLRSIPTDSSEHSESGSL